MKIPIATEYKLRWLALHTVKIGIKIPPERLAFLTMGLIILRWGHIGATLRRSHSIYQVFSALEAAKQFRIHMANHTIGIGSLTALSAHIVDTHHFSRNRNLSAGNRGYVCCDMGESPSFHC